MRVCVCAQVSTVQPGTVKVIVHDLCLAFQTPASATVHISNILEVTVRVVDKVSCLFFFKIQPPASVCNHFELEKNNKLADGGGK